MTKRIIFHIDANSAYLSWEAVYRLQHGNKTDLRQVPSIVGGDSSQRHGIVLAKSIPAKKYNIKTGESLFSAFSKCPNLISIPPHYSLYIKCSDAMVNILKEYSPSIQRYSIDECFLDYTNLTKHFGSPIIAATTIKNRIRDELGFTVNIGISSNKLLAKMASDFQKPDNIHTLFAHEIESKMWPLPVKDLFMVGSRTTPKLHSLGIYTIGDLANSDKDIIYSHLKSHGILIHNYANGLEDSVVRKSNYEVIKGMGNSTTIAFDVDDIQTAHKILLSLTETVCMRVRKANMATQLISVSIKNSDFYSASHQRKLAYTTDSTNNIYLSVKELFNELWNGEPIRKLGVRVSELTSNDFIQTSLFDNKNSYKYKALDKSIDNIRERFGSDSIYRACFLNSRLQPMSGGNDEEDDYPMMASQL